MLEDRLLIIDDDVEFRNYVRRVAEASGFDTFATGEADTFRQQIRNWHPSVIIMDLNMPGTDGIELLRDLVEAKTRAKILIASGVDQKVLDTARKLAAQRGLAVAGTLHKPVRAAALRDALEQLRELEGTLLVGALAHAIRSDDLVLEYQAKIDCETRRITAVEALVRWQHPTRGLIMPERFIALAEQSGLIEELTRWVIANAVAASAKWRSQGIFLDIAVNISARNLENITLPDFIAATCAAAEVPPETVTLELTETAAMSDPAQMMDVLTRLRLKGFRLSIDDFGTGYSSLVQLQRLPFSELKIDKSFVTAMSTEEDCRSIAEIVILLGKKLGLMVVAEGVETADVLTMLIQLGADAAQGYHIGRPVRAEQIAEMVGATADAT